jgi:hypothetical protein
VQYLAISGEQTATNGLPYFNSLAQQKCAVIVAAGPIPVEAMKQGKARFPGIQYVAVGAPGDNSVTSVEPTAVNALISEAARRTM